jgi:signal transduction histidine kinase
VERNLHDGAQQRLVNLSLALGMAQRQVDDAGDALAAATLRDASAELKLAIADLRELARGIHPAILTDDGLAGALESLAERSPVPIALHAGAVGQLPSTVEATAYFVVSEALANVAKHARATGAAVTTSRSNGTLRVEVADDGVGGADPSHGSGLNGLADRLAAVDGRLVVDSAPGGGTRLVAEIPCG